MIDFREISGPGAEFKVRGRISQDAIRELHALQFVSRVRPAGLDPTIVVIYPVGGAHWGGECRRVVEAILERHAPEPCGGDRAIHALREEILRIDRNIDRADQMVSQADTCFRELGNQVRSVKAALSAIDKILSGPGDTKS